MLPELIRWSQAVSSLLGLRMQVRFVVATELDIFESLGANCEFGQVLRQTGNEVPTLFRWTGLVSPEALIAILDADLRGLFSFDDLVPFNADMVLDVRAGVMWHSQMRSGTVDHERDSSLENLRFIFPEEARRAQHKQELRVMDYLCEMTRRSLRADHVIFVYKPLPTNLDFDEGVASRVFDALNRRGSHKFLFVTEAQSYEKAGSVKVIRPGLVHGFIDRFAPGYDTADVSLDCWLSICREARFALDGNHNQADQSEVFARGNCAQLAPAMPNPASSAWRVR
jgi:hypothetical protein